MADYPYGNPKIANDPYGSDNSYGSNSGYNPSYNNPYSQSAQNKEDNYTSFNPFTVDDSMNQYNPKQESKEDPYKKAMRKYATMQGVGALGGLGIGALGIGIGLYQNSQRGDRPKLFTSDGLNQAYSDAYANKDKGFTPQEYNTFTNNVNTANRTQQQQIQDQSGGQSAQAIAGSLGANTLNAYNQYAVGDANQMRQNKEQFYNQAQIMQHQKNFERTNEQQYYDKNTDRIGATTSTGLENFGNAVGKLAPLLLL